MNPNIRVIERYFDAVWSTGDTAAQATLIAESYTGHWLIAGMPVRHGPADHRAWVASVRAGLPDASYTIHEIVGDGDRVAARVTLRGTHLGPIAGLAPTRAATAVDQIFLFHLADGQITHEWVSFDRDSFMRQLAPA